MVGAAQGEIVRGKPDFWNNSVFASLPKDTIYRRYDTSFNAKTAPKDEISYLYPELTIHQQTILEQNGVFPKEAVFEYDESGKLINAYYQDGAYSGLPVMRVNFESPMDFDTFVAFSDALPRSVRVSSFYTKTNTEYDLFGGFGVPYGYYKFPIIVIADSLPNDMFYDENYPFLLAPYLYRNGYIVRKVDDDIVGIEGNYFDSDTNEFYFPGVEECVADHYKSVLKYLANEGLFSLEKGSIDYFTPSLEYFEENGFQITGMIVTVNDYKDFIKLTQNEKVQEIELIRNGLENLK